MQDWKNLPKRTKPKPPSLMTGFMISLIYAAFCGFVIGCVLTAIRNGG